MPEIPAKRIGIVRLSAIGDVVHGLALANGLRRGYPDARICWIIEPLPWEVVRYQPAVDRFILFKARDGAGAWRQLRHDLREEPFDLLVIPQVSMKGGLVSRLARARIRLGFDSARGRELHGLFINRRIPARPVQHAVDQNLEFLNYLGIPVEEPEWDLVVTWSEQEEAHAFYDALGRPAVALVAASSRPEKDWAAENYAALADRIDAELGMHPVVLGGPGARDREIADRIRNSAKSRPLISLDGPIRQTMLKLWGSSIVVAPDTGPLHIAVALGRPTVGLYGYTNPRRTGPYRFHDLLVDRYNDPGQERAPITRFTRPGRMEAITVDEVFEKVRLASQRYPRGREA
jgi:heptosyltransferase I